MSDANDPSDVDVPRFPFVLLDVTEDEADALSAMLFDLGAQGVEERDATTLVKGEAGKTTLVASFATREEADDARAALAEENAAWNARIEEVVGDAWRDAWKEHFRPFTLCEGIVVRPPWEAYEPKGGGAAETGVTAETVLELEPGRAFGTGLHETTSLVADALARHRATYAGGEVLDVGTGSGILALVALVLGASRARAVDNDPDVVDVVRENAERNGLAARIEVDTTPASALAGTYAIVVANIEADVLVKLASELTPRVAPGKLLVLSGVLVPQKERVRAAYAELDLVEAPEKGEWTAIVLRRP